MEGEGGRRKLACAFNNAPPGSVPVRGGCPWPDVKGADGDGGRCMRRCMLGEVHVGGGACAMHTSAPSTMMGVLSRLRSATCNTARPSVKFSFSPANIPSRDFSTFRACSYRHTSTQAHIQIYLPRWICMTCAHSQMMQHEVIPIHCILHKDLHNEQ